MKGSKGGKGILRNRTQKIGLAGILTAVALLGVGRLVKACEPYQNQEILFSEDEQFQEQDFILKLSTLLHSDIYYTLDGSEPTDGSLHYEDGISLEAGESCGGVPVRAIAYYGDGHTSDVYTKTYFLGKNVKERFSTAIVELTGDPEELFDYENGILVTGKLRDDYVMEHPDEVVTDADPANYNIRGYEGERQVQAEIWEPAGSTVLNQKLGIRVNGGLSRGLDVKSLRLIAREEYGEKRIGAELPAAETWEKPYFPKRLLLRNHGNDQEYGCMRNELGAKLAADAGFPCVQRFRAASVWINGEYYGFEWLEDYIDNIYLKHLHQAEEKDGYFGLAEPYRESAGEQTEREKEIQAELQEVMAYGEQDLTDDAAYQELAARLDVENFLQYCAIELCVANADWPTNNCKAYRWYSDTDTYEKNTGMDGRWRFALYDLDMSMGRITETAYDTHSLALTLGVENNGWKNEFPLLKALLKRKDMQQEFTRILEAYLEGPFSTENAKTRMAEIEDEMAGELEWQIQAFAAKEAEKSGEAYEDVYSYKKLMHTYEKGMLEEFWENRQTVLREELTHLDEYVRQEVD